MKPLEEGRDDPKKDVSVNSIAFNQFINKKKFNDERKQIADRDKVLVMRATITHDKDDFVKRKEEASKNLRMSGNGKFICEKVNYASKDE